MFYFRNKLSKLAINFVRLWSIGIKRVQPK